MDTVAQDKIISDIYTLFSVDEWVIDIDDYLVYPKVGRLWHKILKRFAGHKSNGYLNIWYQGKHIGIHRFIWEAVYGKIPDGLHINHIDLDRANNCIDNLELVSHSQNQQWRNKNKNNTSGFKGVSWCKKAKKWVSRIKINRKSKFLGQFDTPEAAYAAYCKHAKYLNETYGCKYKL